MKAAIQRYLHHLDKDRKGARNTLLAYRTDLSQFERVIASRAEGLTGPEGLTLEMLAGYAEWLARQGFRPSTVSRKMAAVRSFLGFLDDQGVLRELPYHVELRAPPPPRSQPRILTPEEVARLLRAPAAVGSPRGLRDVAILELLYATGLRASEAVRLDLSDLDQPAERLRRSRPVPAWIPLGAASPALQKYMATGRPFLARTDGEQALFLNLRGKRLSRQGVWLVVKRWSKAADLGEGISPHSLRHSMVHHWLERGRTKQEIQQILGLSSPSAVRVKVARRH